MLLARAALFAAVVILDPVRGASNTEPANHLKRTEQYFFDAFGIEMGQPGMVTHATVQTRDGYLWVGTHDGLMRFDGVSFVNLSAVNAQVFTSHCIRSLFEDHQDNLWVGTDAGLIRYHAGTFTKIDLTDVSVTALAEDRSGVLWIGTAGKGLFSCQKDRFQRHEPAALPSVVRRLFIDSQDQVWVAFEKDKGVLCLGKDGSFCRYDLDTKSMGEVQAICELPRGTLWFGTLNRGLFRLKEGKFLSYGTNRGLAGTQVTDLLPSKDGGMWVAANTLQKIVDINNFTLITVPRVPTENVRRICEDREGNVWLCAQAEGLIRMRQMPYRVLTTDDGLPGNGVKTVAEDKKGNLWLAIQHKGLTKVAPDGTVSVYAEKAGLPGNDPSVAFPASDGTVWLGAGGKLCAWRENECRVFDQYSLLRTAYEDRNGVVWLAVDDIGLLKYQHGQFTPIELSPGHPIPRVSAFCEGSDGTLYIGTWCNGVLQLKDGLVSALDSNDGLPVDDVRAVYSDKDGVLWVGLKNRGLAVFQSGHWYNPDAVSHAVADNVSAIAEDDRGLLWLGTLAGVMCVPKKDMLAAEHGRGPVPKPHLEGLIDGFQSASVWSAGQPVVSKTSDDQLLFATRHGVVAIDPHRLASNEVIPPVHIEKVTADQKLINDVDGIHIPAGTREVLIEYTALSFVRPNAVLFKYKLEGYDKSWMEAGARRTALYAGLPPGKYLFKVIACNSDGLWNETGDQTKLIQKPHFYETWWFYSAVLIISFTAALGFHHWRTEILRRENEKLNRLVT
ncbi:MAG TPA: two-component regulator propeller domain-containing protein, partial [Opitutaceae bacterium]|nr:two-component regulator propeller domain-containing protein [Opitutaceae bacterium]